jgi:hypothetical protein
MRAMSYEGSFNKKKFEMEMHDGIKTNKIFIENNMCQY